MEVFNIVDRNGNKVFGNKSLCNKNPKGNIIIVHGMAEHSARYEDFMKFLNQNGFNVYALDHLGHKLNCKTELGDDELGVWRKNGFSTCVDRVKDLIDEVNKNELPTYIFSHSMGSFITQMLMERYPGVATKICLCGSSGKQGVYRIGRNICRLHCFGKKLSKPSKFINHLTFGSYNKRIKNYATKFDWLSANEENVNLYMQDEYCGFIPSRGFFLSFTNALVKIFKKHEIRKVDKNTNVLLIAGQDDPVGGYGKYVRKLHQQYIALGLNCKLELYKGLRHEILNEKEKMTIYNEILSFFKK